MKRNGFRVAICVFAVGLLSVSAASAQRVSGTPALATNLINMQEVFDVTLHSGFTFARSFMLKGEQFVFCHNSNTGKTAVWNLKKGGAPVFETNWSKGWTNLDFYEYAGNVYFFHQKGAEGTARIAKLDYTALMAGKSIGDNIYEDKWSEGWTFTKFFVHNDLVYFFHYKSGSGLARMNVAGSGGTVGEKIYEKTWAKGYSNFSLVENNGSLYFLYQNSSSGECKINRMDMTKLEVAARSGLISPNLGTVVYEAKWSSGWTDVSFFKIKDQVFMFHHKSGNGLTRVNRINSNGTVGDKVFEETWTKGWSNFSLFINNGTSYLFGQKSSDGRTALNILKL